MLWFDAVPWLSRAQQEHDALTALLAGRGVEVLPVTRLLQDVLEQEAARDQVIDAVLAADGLGDDLGRSVRRHLDGLTSQDLTTVLVAGLTSAELVCGRGLVYELLDPRDFVVSPLPNLVFTADASAWIGDQAVLAGLPGPRRKETALAAAIYSHHPRFAGTRPPYQAAPGPLDGGDIVLLGPGVAALGVGAGTCAASAERLAGHLLGSGIVHTVLAVPIAPGCQAGRLDRTCTVVGYGTVVMVPALAFSLTALTITVRFGEQRVTRPQPFLEAAARALRVEALTVIDTGVEPHATPRWSAEPSGQWDDGGNVLMVGPGVVVGYDRCADTNARLTAAGFEVLTVPGGELGGLRGGPRGMCAPVGRDSAPIGGQAQAHDNEADLLAPLDAELAPSR